MNRLQASGVRKDAATGGRTVHILRGIDLEIAPGEFVAIMGPSGSGKSTLLGLLAGLDRPTAGSIQLDGEELTALGEDALARLRARKMGFVFQSFHLIPSLTAEENVALPLELLGAGGAAALGRAREVLAGVGLAERATHYPAQLSGGEQQRVAVARAFAARPAVLLADEPTGNLDAAAGAQVLDLLSRLNRDEQVTVVLVTHDAEAASRAGRVVRLRDGSVVAGEPGRAGA